MTENEKNKLEMLTAKLKQDPSDYKVRKQFAFALLDNDMPEEALKQFNKLVSIMPNEANLHYNIGLIYEKLKMMDSAKMSLKKPLNYHLMILILITA